MLARLLALMILLAASWRSHATSAPVVEIPFEFRAGLIWVHAETSHAPTPLNFILDSGAGVSVINLRTARRLGVKLGQRVGVHGVGGSAEGFWPQRLEAKAGAVALPKEYLAVDLAELSRACDCCVDGLIGADFFRSRVVQIDFAASKIRLLPASCEAGDASVVDMKTSRRALLAAVGVNDGKPQWMRVDTGCVSALQWVVSGSRRLDEKNGISIGLAAMTVPTARTTVTLGEVTFDSVPTGLHPRPIFPGESGLLGNGLLARFERVTFDSKNGKLLLQGRGSRW